MSVVLTSVPGSFEGYASLFGVPDLSRDIVVAGAFRETILKSGPESVRLLWQHDPSEPIGIWTALQEDSKGLFARGRLNLETQRGRELDALIRQGAVNGLSIGFRTKRARRNANGFGRDLLAVDLWEISLVTFPLLPDARLMRASQNHMPTSLDALIRRASGVFHSQSDRTQFMTRSAL